MRTISIIATIISVITLVSAFITTAAAGFVPYWSASNIHRPDLVHRHPSIPPAVLNPQQLMLPTRVLLAGNNFVSGINLASSSPPGNVTFDGNNTLFGHNTLGGNVIVHGLNNIITGQTLATQQDILSSVTTVPLLPGLFAIGPPAIANTVSALNTIQNPTLFFLNVVKPALDASNIVGVKTSYTVDFASASLSCPAGQNIKVITAIYASIDSSAPTCGINVSSSPAVTTCNGKNSCTITNVSTGTLGVADPCYLKQKALTVYYTCIGSVKDRLVTVRGDSFS